MKNKRWLRSVAFLTLLALAVVGVMHCYGLPKNYISRSFATFESEEENTIDGVILGTSVIGYSWTATSGWLDYGLTIFPISTSSQPFGIMPEYIDYVRETQDVKYAIIDIHGLRSSTARNGLRPGVYRTAYLNVPNLEHRYKILNALFKYAQRAYEAFDIPESEQDDYIKLYDLSYYIPFLNFHGRWIDEGLKKADFVAVENKYKGADDRQSTFKVEDCTKYIDRWDYELLDDISDFQKFELQRIFDYGKENDIELLFINLPSFRTKEEQQEVATLVEYCRQQGYNTIDFSTVEMLEKVGIDIKTDFVNKGHLNSKGGVKITKYICEYLIENGYYTPDHRGEAGYESWDTAAAAYLKFYNEGWNKED